VLLFPLRPVSHAGGDSLSPCPNFRGHLCIALINSIGQLGGIVSPVFVGRIKDVTGSSTPALYAIGALCLVAGALLLFALPEKLRRSDRSV